MVPGRVWMALLATSPEAVAAVVGCKVRSKISRLLSLPGAVAVAAALVACSVCGRGTNAVCRQHTTPMVR